MITMHQMLSSPSFTQNWIHHDMIMLVLSNADIIDILQCLPMLLLGDGKITGRRCQFLHWKHWWLPSSSKIKAYHP